MWRNLSVKAATDWSEERKSYLGHEHAAQCHRGTETDTEAHGDNLVVGTKVNGNKGQPDDAGGVHGKSNVLSLIEISWDIAGLEERESGRKCKETFLYC